MSFDLAVWEGPEPDSSEAAADRLDELNERYREHREPPTPAIAGFVKALTATYPDLNELPDDQVDESPWADGPLIGNASGPFFYFAMSFSRVEEVLPFVVETARAHRLVCFDPQSGELL